MHSGIKALILVDPFLVEETFFFNFLNHSCVFESADWLLRSMFCKRTVPLKRNPRDEPKKKTIAKSHDEDEMLHLLSSSIEAVHGLLLKTHIRS